MIRNNFFSGLFGILAAWSVTDTVAREAIVGGIVAGFLDFGYQVSIHIENHGHGCGGAIMSEKAILTAASCVLNSAGNVGGKPISVLAGTIDLRRTDPPAIYIDVKRVYVPKKRTAGDIAVLQLSRPLPLAKHRVFERISLPINQNNTFQGAIGQIAGFGWSWIHANGQTMVGGRNGTRLLYANAKVLSHLECRWNHPTFRIDGGHLCAKVEQYSGHQASGACVGDGGSPLVHNRIMIGIFSQGPKGCNETSFSGIYTRVSHHLRFIRNAKEGTVTNTMRVLDASVL